MPVLLQAVARLAALRPLGVLLFVLAATLRATNTASAHERLQTKTRVRNFELGEHHSHVLLTPAKQRNASGKSRCWCPNSHQIHSYRWRDPSGRGAAEDWAGELLDAAAEFAPGPGGAANDNAVASEVEAAEAESPLGLAVAAATTSVGIFADQVQGLAQEMFEQQDADANAIARASAAARPAAGGNGNEPPCDTKGGRGPVDKGRAGAERAIDQIRAEGGDVIGREITLQSNGVNTRPDLLIRNASGDLEFVEVKNGHEADLTPNQRQGFPGIRAGGAVPVGANAAAAGLVPGEPLPAIGVRVIWYP